MSPVLSIIFYLREPKVKTFSILSPRRKPEKFPEAMDNSPCSQSESESSLDGHAMNSSMAPPSPISREQLQKRIDSLNQQNKVLRVELDTYKIRVKQLQEENKTLRQASVNIVSQS